MLNKNKKGFTLIELIVVMAIIGILVLLAMPKFLDYTQRARITNIRHDVKVAEDKIEEYLIKYHKLPDDWVEVTKEQLEALKDEKKLYNKEGLVENNVDDGEYKIIKDDFVKTEIRSKLKGTFYANNNGKVYYEDTKAGKPEEKPKEDGCPVVTCNYKLIDVPEEFWNMVKEYFPPWGATDFGYRISYNAYEYLDGKQIFVLFEDGEIVEIVDIQKFIETEGDEEAIIEIGDVELPTCLQKLDENGKLVECPSNNINDVLCEITSDDNLLFKGFKYTENGYALAEDIRDGLWILDTVGYDNYKLVDDDEFDLSPVPADGYKKIWRGDFAEGFGPLFYKGIKSDNSLWKFGEVSSYSHYGNNHISGDVKIFDNVKDAFLSIQGEEELVLLEDGQLYRGDKKSESSEHYVKIMDNVKDVHLLNSKQAKYFDGFFITTLNGDVFGWTDSINGWLPGRDSKFKREEPVEVNLDIKELLGFTRGHLFFLTNSNEIKYWDGKADNEATLLVGDVKEFGAIRVVYNSFGSDNRFVVHTLNSNNELWETELIESGSTGNIENILRTKISDNVKSISFSNSSFYVKDNRDDFSYITGDNKLHYSDYYGRWREIEDVEEVLYHVDGLIFKYLDGTVGYIEEYNPDEIVIGDNAAVLRKYNYDGDYSEKAIFSTGNNVTILFPNPYYGGEGHESIKFLHGKIKDVAIANNDRIFVLNENNELYELKNDIWVKVGSVNSCVDYVFYMFHAG